MNFQNFLEGYIPNSRLMIVVSSNTKIIASNERRLLDSSTKDNPLFKQVLLNKKNGDVVHVKTKEFDCFGIAENCRDFSIFIFDCKDKLLLSFGHKKSPTLAVMHKNFYGPVLKQVGAVLNTSGFLTDKARKLTRHIQRSCSLLQNL